MALTICSVIEKDFSTKESIITMRFLRTLRALEMIKYRVIPTKVPIGEIRFYE